MEDGNSHTRTYTFTNRGEVATLTLADSSEEQWSYDGNGNCTAYENPLSQTINYVFDNAGRETGIDYPTGTDTSFSYDNADRRTGMTDATGTTTWGYDAAGRTTSVVTGAGTTSLSYDYEDRVSGITYPSSATNSFTYNGLDTRVGKVDSSGTSTYKRDGAGVTAPVLSDETIAYTPGISERKSTTTTFDHADYLGTFTRQTNSSQSTTATRVYDAFGNLESTTGTPQSPFGFVGGQGYQEDGDAGLKLLGYRYYDPSTGKFLTRDPAKDGRNWYVYTESETCSRTDAAGLDDGINDPGPLQIPPPNTAPFNPTPLMPPLPPFDPNPPRGGPIGPMKPVPPFLSWGPPKKKPPFTTKVGSSSATGSYTSGNTTVTITITGNGSLNGGKPTITVSGASGGVTFRFP